MPNDVLSFMSSILSAVSHFLGTPPMIYVTALLIEALLVRIFLMLIRPSSAK